MDNHTLVNYCGGKLVPSGVGQLETSFHERKSTNNTSVLQHGIIFVLYCKLKNVKLEMQNMKLNIDGSLGAQAVHTGTIQGIPYTSHTGDSSSRRGTSNTV